MSSDSSKPTDPHNPLEVATEGLVIRPEIFNDPMTRSADGDHKSSVAEAHAAVAREKGEFNIPSLSKAIPIWVLIPIIGVGIAAGSFLGPNLSSTPNIKGYDYALTFPDGAGSAGPVLDEYDPKVWLAKGKAEYSTVCASCHQATGEGIAGQYPPLKGSEWVTHGEERVVSILLHGIAGPLQVNGKGYNLAMPAQGALKNNKAIAQLVSYIRNDWGNKGSIVYDDQVNEIRKKLTARTAPFTEAELKAIPQDANLPPSKHGAAPDAAAATAAPAADAAAATAAPAAPAPN